MKNLGAIELTQKTMLGRGGEDIVSAERLPDHLAQQFVACYSQK